MRAGFGLLLGSVMMLGCRAQSSTPTELPANLIIPNPPPVEALSGWRDAPGRSKITTQMGDVTLRGFRYEGHDPRHLRCCSLTVMG